MECINCLFNFDDINYKIFIMKDCDEAASLDEFLQALSQHEDLRGYDFAQDFFIFEIFDTELNEYVRFESDTKITDMSKIRVQVLDMDEIIDSRTTDDVSDDNDQVEKQSIEKEPEFLQLSAKKHPSENDIGANSDQDQKTFGSSL